MSDAVCWAPFKQYEYVDSAVVTERGQDGTVPVWYVLGQGGERLYTLHWSTTTPFLRADVYTRDHLGSIRQVVDATGAVANAYSYDAFGVPVIAQKTLSNSYLCAGAANDVAEVVSPSDGTPVFYASLYNLQARLYDPRAGRFLTEDTVQGNPWTQNLYVYAGNNPVNYTDPTGHFPIAAWLPSPTQVITTVGMVNLHRLDGSLRGCRPRAPIL